jgi:hypothetical protein
MSLDEPRKRIPYKKNSLLPIEDEMAFIKNKCSERARKVNSIKPNLVFDVWFDQHYQIRQQFGDDNGVREGIDSKKVESLILKSMKYLIAYSSFLKTFSFINHDLNGGRSNRIVLQESTDEGRLNVVIEAHLLNVDTYEITVKTAMRNDSFLLSDGQFALEIFDNESVLKRMERGSIREIYNL